MPELVKRVYGLAFERDEVTKSGIRGEGRITGWLEVEHAADLEPGKLLAWLEAEARRGMLPKGTIPPSWVLDRVWVKFRGTVLFRRKR